MAISSFLHDAVAMRKTFITLLEVTAITVRKAGCYVRDFAVSSFLLVGHVKTVHTRYTEGKRTIKHQL